MKVSVFAVAFLAFILASGGKSKQKSYPNLIRNLYPSWVDFFRRPVSVYFVAKAEPEAGKCLKGCPFL